MTQEERRKEQSDRDEIMEVGKNWSLQSTEPLEEVGLLLGEMRALVAF